MLYLHLQLRHLVVSQLLLFGMVNYAAQHTQKAHIVAPVPIKELMLGYLQNQVKQQIIKQAAEQSYLARLSTMVAQQHQTNLQSGPAAPDAPSIRAKDHVQQALRNDAITTIFKTQVNLSLHIKRLNSTLDQIRAVYKKVRRGSHRRFMLVTYGQNIKGTIWYLENFKKILNQPGPRQIKHEELTYKNIGDFLQEGETSAVNKNRADFFKKFAAHFGINIKSMLAKILFLSSDTAIDILVNGAEAELKGLL